MNITVLGAGSWGTTVAKVLAEKHGEVTLWVRGKELADRIANDRENKKYLPGVKLPKGIMVMNNPEEAVAHAEIVVTSIPSQYLRPLLKEFSDHIPQDAIIVNTAKGLQQA